MAGPSDTLGNPWIPLEICLWSSPSLGNEIWRKWKIQVGNGFYRDAGTEQIRTFLKIYDRREIKRNNEKIGICKEEGGNFQGSLCPREKSKILGRATKTDKKLKDSVIETKSTGEKGKG
jgi:hypothetical protein